MLETSARLLRLLSLLQTPRDWTGTELAERLEVSGRTVRNDIERLRTLGYPVHAARGAVGGYRLGAGAALPPLLLDDDEAVAIAVGLRAAAGGSVAGVAEASLRALTKLERVLPTRLRHRLTALHSYTVAVPAPAGPPIDPATLTTLSAACRDTQRLRFGYTGHDGAASTRLAEPYRLVSWGRRWYLVAWDCDRADWRTFRVDRLADVAGTGHRFAPRPLPDEDVARYVSRSVGAAVWRYRVEVTVQAPAAAVAARLPVPAGTVEPVDDARCTVRTGSDSLDAVATWLGMLGADFTVVSPPELADALRRLGERYLRAAGPRVIDNP
jgi:predicted DNA-binding transcriptional regulator YafY